MRRINNDLLIGIGGLVTCAIMALVGVWEFTIASKEFVRFVPYPIAQFAFWLGDVIADTDAAKASLSYWIYLALWLAHIAIFAASYWLRIHPAIKRSPATDDTLLLLQLAALLSGERMLLCLFAFELPFVMQRVKAVAWLICSFALSAIINALVAQSAAGDLSQADIYMSFLNLGYVAMYVVMHFSVGLLAAKERSDRNSLEKAHAELASANAELLATQMLLADTVRAAERLRIARDLHDSIGHNLMAQNLHLDLAVRQCGPDALEPVTTARELARTILREIRRMVAIERSVGAVDLRGAIETYCANMPLERIVLSIDGELNDLTPQAADTVLKNVQEIVGGTARQPDINALRVIVTRSEDCILVQVQNEGNRSFVPGMEDAFSAARARIEKLGGSFLRRQAGEDDAGVRFMLPLLHNHSA